MGALGESTRRGAAALRGGGRALQGRARRHRGGRHLPLPQGDFTDLCRGPAPAELGADQGGQAHVARRRVLARRREEPAADPDLRHGVLRPEGPRRAPRAPRGGEAPRPPAARPQLDLFDFSEHRARDAVLAPQGHGDLERARGPPPPRERASAATSRCKTPQLYDAELWRTSGHWEKFRDDMFLAPRSRSRTSGSSR